ncbi:ABC transporter permease [Chitinophaga solisilvae]|uniref:FtsX-like permease family protein n=1 Tax=Chitinophaga solisilvae TaxID=1233460 RepID=A0A3S1B478_9BACT|nr:ABC transporter permease [Chitinophaga solisilvae]NSL91160.1 FtsX-like permease family protein [Chitinophaga solisilvae]
MFRNYLLIAWRNLVRYKYYSLINIAGLSIGLATCWLLLLYVFQETSYDSFYPNKDRIYRAVNSATWTGGSLNLATTSPPFAAVLKKDYPEIAAITRILPDGGSMLKYGEKKLQADNLFFVDTTFFRVFAFHLIAGDTATALAAPNSLVLTRKLAASLFGDPLQAVGKTLLTEDSATIFHVTGVMEDVPDNAHFHFTGLRLIPENYDADGWQSFSMYTYMLLHKGVTPQMLESKLPKFATRYIRPQMGDVQYKMTLQPLTSIHLHSRLGYEMEANGSILYVYVFLLVGLMILIIACINYMNLATARAIGRVKEVGVRKTMGSGRDEIAGMFLSESLLLTCIASLVAFVLVYLSLPYFSVFADKPLHMWQFGVWRTIAGILLLSLFTALLAGIYPAVFMSGFRIISALKGRLSGSSHTGFRKGLVTFQFVIAIVLTASTLVAYDQLEYVMHTNLGFDKDQVLSFHLGDLKAREKVKSLKEQLTANPLVLSAASANNPIGHNSLGTSGLYFEQADGQIAESSFLSQFFMADADFVKTMGIQLQAGRNFSDTGNADRYHAVLVNETLVKEMQLKEPLGKRVQFKIDNSGRRAERVVVGVMKDFHVYSLQHKIAPLIIQMPPASEVEDNIYVKISRQNIPAALAHIEKVYHQFDAEHPFSYSFLDDNFAKQYAGERQQEKIFLMFTVLALFIACLGLFGLAAFTAVQRTREIGVRKTLGASTGSIVRMLSRDFLRLVLLAALVAFPLSWWIMDRWLHNFAYRTGISIWVFVMTGAGVTVIALATVSFHALKAATANPVKSLKAD